MDPSDGPSEAVLRQRQRRRLGLAFAVAVTAVASIGLVPLILCLLVIGAPHHHPEPKVGPVIEGQESYEHVEGLAAVDLDESGLDELIDMVERVALAPSARRAAEVGVLDEARILDESTRDERMLWHVAGSIEAHAQSKAFMRALDRAAPDHAAALQQVRDAGLPEPVSMWPYHRDRFASGLSPAELDLARRAWSDPAIARSGAAVVLTLMTLDSGLETPRLPGRRPMAAALESGVGSPLHRVVGENIRCAPDSPEACPSVFSNPTQHVGYTLVAQYFVAMCLYRQGYADLHPIYAEPAPAVDPACDVLHLPTRAEIHRWMP